MKLKLYKLAVWYINKYKQQWDTDDKLDISELDTLTYKSGQDNYYLYYGLDAQWSKLICRYSVIENAIRKLYEYEHIKYEAVR